MAVIRSATLESSKSRRSVRFQADIDMRFERRELNSEWEVKMRLYEDDNFRDDNLRSEAVRRFRPSSTTTRLQLERSVSKSTVDTELGDEEVYAKVSLRPLESPRPFASDSANTGIEVVNE